MDPVGRPIKSHKGVACHVEEVVHDIHEPGELRKNHNAVALDLQTAEQAYQSLYFAACTSVVITGQSVVKAEACGCSVQGIDSPPRPVHVLSLPLPPQISIQPNSPSEIKFIPNDRFVALRLHIIAHGGLGAVEEERVVAALTG